MTPDQRGEVGEIVVADFHAVQPDLVGGFLHIDGVPVHDGIECEAKGAKLFFLSLLERASDFAALAMVNAPAEAMTQFSVVELGQDASPERRIVNVAQNIVRNLGVARHALLLLRALPLAAPLDAVLYQKV